MRKSLDVAYVVVLSLMVPRRCDLFAVVLVSLGTNLFSSMLIDSCEKHVSRIAFFSFFAGVSVFILGASLEDTYLSVRRSSDDHSMRHPGQSSFYKFAGLDALK